MFEHRPGLSLFILHGRGCVAYAVWVQLERLAIPSPTLSPKRRGEAKGAGRTIGLNVPGQLALSRSRNSDRHGFLCAPPFARLSVPKNGQRVREGRPNNGAVVGFSFAVTFADEADNGPHRTFLLSRPDVAGAPFLSGSASEVHATQQLLCARSKTGHHRLVYRARLAHVGIRMAAQPVVPWRLPKGSIATDFGRARFERCQGSKRASGGFDGAEVPRCNRSLPRQSVTLAGAVVDAGRRRRWLQQGTPPPGRHPHRYDRSLPRSLPRAKRSSVSAPGRSGAIVISRMVPSASSNHSANSSGAKSRTNSFGCAPARVGQR